MEAGHRTGHRDLGGQPELVAEHHGASATASVAAAPLAAGEGRQRHRRWRLAAVATCAGGTFVAAAALTGHAPGSALFRQDRRRLSDAEACEDSGQWDQIAWVYLSAVEQRSWSLLGWTQQTWDALHPAADATPGTSSSSTPTRTAPASERTCFQDLTEVQQDAVRTLGYTIGSWHACKKPTCTWPPGIPKPDDPCLAVMQYLEGRFGPTTGWNTFSEAKKNALVDLGWDAAGSAWTAWRKPAIFARRWTDLLSSEAAAATFLGYQPRVWEGCEAETPCIERLRLIEARMKNLNWDTMLLGIRARLEDLGWDRKSWEEGTKPIAYRTRWDSLEFSKQVAARLLGFTGDVWDGCPNVPCITRFSYIMEKYRGIPWSAMNMAQQRAWMLLGQSPALWTESGIMATTSRQARWEELSPEQQQQANFLGYTLDTWQGCNTNWVAPNMNSTVVVTTTPNPVRAVRARMTIQRPFSEISGNVYGNAVGAVPVSFITMFQNSVARALFCGNPPLSFDRSAYLDSSGKPLCVLTDEFERQRNRIRVLTVVEGSIVVDFQIVPNQTAAQMTAPGLLQALQRQLESAGSPLVQDAEFGKYAQAATIQEVPFSDRAQDEFQQAIVFERLRGSFTEQNACQLTSDTRNGVIRCPSSATRVTPFLAGLLGLTFWLDHP